MDSLTRIRYWMHFFNRSFQTLPSRNSHRTISSHPILFRGNEDHISGLSYMQWQCFKESYKKLVPLAPCGRQTFGYRSGTGSSMSIGAISSHRNTASNSDHLHTMPNHVFSKVQNHVCSEVPSQRRTFTTLASNIQRIRTILNNMEGYYIKAHCDHSNKSSDALNENDKVDVIKFIRDNTELTRDHLTPELQLHLLTKQCTLWYGPGAESPIQDPFWAFYWPGGQALTRYLLDNPSLVQGKRILDVGSGCGASSIAAAKLGASYILANDIDPVAEIAIQLNCEANGVENVDISTDNLIGKLEDQWDVILLGDVFYDEEFTNQVTDWIEALQPRPTTILIGDPGRVYFKDNPIRSKMKLVYEFELPKHLIEENNGLTHGYVWEYIPNSPKL